jgi:hypothetical protein
MLSSIIDVVVSDFVVVSVIVLFDVDMASWTKEDDAMPKFLFDNNCLYCLELLSVQKKQMLAEQIRWYKYLYHQQASPL